MRFLLCALLWCLSSFIGFSQSPLVKIIDFKIDNKTIPQTLWSLSEQTQIPISLKDNDFSKKTYSFQFNKTSVRQILQALLRKEDHSYAFNDGQLIIKKTIKRKIIISGYIEDADSGQRLIGANIFTPNNDLGTNSNVYGFFSFTSTQDISFIQVSYLGYQTAKFEINKSSVSPLNIKLEKNNELSEVIVIANKASNKSFKINENENEILNDQLSTPSASLGGVNDVMRVIQQLPGVQSGTDGVGGLHVRGGNADQNLVLLDGIPIYNPYHALGLFSLFEKKSIQKIDYYSGGFPARFGGRLSSVLDVRTKDGNNKYFKANIGVGLIASNLSIEGPIVKDKAAFFITARRSHLDPFLKGYSKKQNLKNSKLGFYNYSFGDFLSKLNYNLNQKDKVYLSVYFGIDRFVNEVGSIDINGAYSFKENIDQELSWGNALIAGRWNHQFSNKLFANTSLTFSRFNFESEDLLNSIYDYAFGIDTLNSQSFYQSQIDNTSLKFDLDYAPNQNHYIRTGVQYSNHTFKPGIVNRRSNEFTLEDPDELLNNSPLIKAEEFKFYLEDDIQVFKNLKINAGLYIDHFKVRKKKYLNINPRFLLNWKMTENLSVHTSISRMNQNVHVLSRAGSGFPTDLWVPSTDNVKPQTAILYDLNLKWKISNQWAASIGVYRKNMNNLINYSESILGNGSGNTLNPTNWESNITSGAGKAVGVEVLLRKNIGQTTGWISYTLSDATRQFTGINQNKVYPFKFNHTHNFNIVVNQKLWKGWSLSGNWSFRSGSFTNIPLSKWQYIRQDAFEDYFYFYLGEKNSFKLPDYHRLDFAINFRHPSNRNPFSFQIGIFNAYDRKNIYFVKTDFDPLSQGINYKSVSLVPFLPYFNIEIKL